MAISKVKAKPVPATKAKPPVSPSSAGSPASSGTSGSQALDQAYALESAYDQGYQDYSTQQGYDTSQAQAAAPGAGNLGGTQQGIQQYEQAAQQSYSSLASFFGTGAGPAEQYQTGYSQPQPAQINQGAAAAAQQA